MSQKYNDYLKTDYWKAVSDAVKKRASYRCQLCNSQHDLSAHHRTYDHRGSELDFLDDLTALCRRCHDIFHGKAFVSSALVPVVKTEEVIVITEENYRGLKYNKETWSWMKRTGINPRKSGWNKRAIGQTVPSRFIW